MSGIEQKGLRILVFALATMFVGCAAAPAPEPVIRTVTVQVPIPQPVYCNPPHLAKPALPLSRLTADSSPADTVRAYMASVLILKGAVSQRDDLLAGCAGPPDDGAKLPAGIAGPSR